MNITLSPRTRSPAKLFPAGKAFVQVFGRAPGPFTIAWREPGGARRRAMRMNWPKAKSFAETKASDLANLETGVQQLSPIDAASHLRALENLLPTGQAIEQATAEHAQRQRRLAKLGVSFDAMADWFEENRPGNFQPRSVADMVAAYLSEKDGTISADYHAHLSFQLHKLASAFTAPMHTLTASGLVTWLGGLKTSSGAALGPRARHNYRAAVDQLARWAKTHGYLPRTWSEMEHVPDPGQRIGEIKILTPEAMTRLITARQQAENCGRAQQTLVPFIALQAWSGIRHEEAVKLDWRDVHFDERFVYVSKGIAKTGRDRILPMADNLAAWLQPYLRRNGPITTLSQISGALTKAKRSAGLPAGKNETKNTLRKSFISYRLALTRSIAQVAEEAGNSPGIIRKHYGRPIPEAESKRWFDIWPTAAEVLQLNFAGM